MPGIYFKLIPFALLFFYQYKFTWRSAGDDIFARSWTRYGERLTLRQRYKFPVCVAERGELILYCHTCLAAM